MLNSLIFSKQLLYQHLFGRVVRLQITSGLSNQHLKGCNVDFV